MAVNGSQAYWVNFNGNRIGQAELDGQFANQSFITGTNGPAGVAVDGSHVYWSNLDGDAIGRADLDGENVNQSFITGADHPTGMAVGP